MKPEKSQPPVSLELERDRVIEELSRHFANDVLSIEELEHRIEAAYRAQSVAAVRELTRDLPSDPSVASVAASRRHAPLPQAFAPESDRIVSFMGETARRGVWQPARHLTVWSIMSETYLDLTQAQLSDGVTEIELRAVMTSLTLIVPPGVRVVMQPKVIMAQVSDEIYDPPPVGSGAPVIRITGTVIMAEVKVAMRTRERSERDAPGAI